MKTVFIILNYNTCELTINLSKKISNYQLIDKVLIVDNCSTDNSYNEFKKIKSDKIEVIQSEKNGGYSYGNNYGAKYAKKYNPEILIFSNPDIDIDENNLALIINNFNKEEYSILTGIEYDVNNEVGKPAYWNLMEYADDLLDCFAITRKILKNKVKKENKIDYTQETQNIPIFKGSFFAIYAKDFFDVNGFDENVFLFCEERILSRKIIDKNKKIGLITKAKYNHNHSVSINKTYKYKYKQMKLLYKSRLYYNRKYSKIGNLKYCILCVATRFSIIEFIIKDIINATLYKVVKSKTIKYKETI